MRWLAGVALLYACPAFADHELLDRDIAKGAQLYQSHCASCHGARLEGQPNWRSPNDDGTLPAPPHDVSGHTWHHANSVLFDYTKLGGQGAAASRSMPHFKSGMPAFAGVISDEGIWSILAFIRSTWPKRAQLVQASRNLPHE